MRRSRREETSHGTSGGQIPIDVALKQKYGLTRREAECASLLRHGVLPGDLSSVLGVSSSTVKKFLASLRAKAHVDRTDALIATLRAAPADDNVAAHHAWPPVPVAQVLHAPSGDAGLAELAARCRGRLHLHGMLEALREYLALPFRARCVFYVFSPLSVLGLLRDDVVREILAPPAIRDAFLAAGHVLDTPSAARLFAEPDSFALVDGRSNDYAAASPRVRAFYDACLADNVRYGISFGFPSGTGFVGISVSLDAEARDPVGLIRTHGDNLRAAAMAMHSCAWSYGALAAEYDLTLRERDALSSLAAGQRTSAAAAELGLSQRALAGTLANARRKMSARTNTEAVAKGIAANALLFRD